MRKMVSQSTNHFKPNNLKYALRVAVVDSCQMKCIYCPISTYENFTPIQFRNRGLSHEEKLIILSNLLRAISFEKVSFTGGEPLLNQKLEDYAQRVHSLVPRLELNTNGLLLNGKRWQSLSFYFNQVKISMDSLSPNIFFGITGINNSDALTKIVAAINIVKNSGIEVVINAVLLRRTVQSILELIDFAYEQGVRLHVLDFSYTDECRNIWEQEFLPAEILMEEIAERYTNKEQVPRFGVGYFEFKLSRQTTVRVRTSLSGSMRSQRCQNCTHYCQTGLFGLMLSTDGWVTTCQGSHYEEDGILLNPDMTPEAIRKALKPLTHELTTSWHQADSFKKFVTLQNLKPFHKPN